MVRPSSITTIEPTVAYISRVEVSSGLSDSCWAAICAATSARRLEAGIGNAPVRWRRSGIDERAKALPADEGRNQRPADPRHGDCDRRYVTGRDGDEREADALGYVLRPTSEGHSHITSADPTAPPPVAGPVGIATQIGDVFWNAGPILTLYVAGILSANLALVNILPFPPLDGGRMLMITLKRLFGRRISLRAEQLTYVVGMVFLFAFILWVTGYDIIRSLTGGTLGAP